MEKPKYPAQDRRFYEDTKYENIFSLAPDTIIYKYIKLEFFKKILEAKKLRVDRISSWADPFENILFKCNCQNAQGERISLKNLEKSVYGLSFTKLAESDALWRIYSPENQSIRFQTTVKKIFDSLYGDGFTYNERISLFFSEVSYLPESELIDLLRKKGEARNAIFSQTPSKFIFLKRDPFSHEQEIRMVFQTASNHAFYGKENLEFAIDPNNLFDGVLVDPRLENKDFEQIRELLLSLDYKNTVEKSNLYGSRTFEVQI